MFRRVSLLSLAPVFGAIFGCRKATVSEAEGAVTSKRALDIELAEVRT